MYFLETDCDLKTVLPWKKYPAVASEASLVPAQVSLVQ